MTNAEVQALEIDIDDLENQLKAKKGRLQQIRWTCKHVWGETRRATLFTYVGASTSNEVQVPGHLPACRLRR